MSLMGGALIVITSGDHRSNNNSDQYQQVFYVAETGLMQGEKWVIDNYLGHWITSVPSHTESLCPEPKVVENDKTEVDVAEYGAKKDEYYIYTGFYEAGKDGYYRHTFDRGPARNDTVITPTSKSACMKSFKNIDAKKKYIDCRKRKITKKRKTKQLFVTLVILIMK